MKRLRIFAGPNGSGKSTLFDEFSKNYNSGYFINADLLEKKLYEKGLIDLNDLGISANQKDLDLFLEKEVSQTLLQKSAEGQHPVNISIKENFIVDRSNDTHSYEASLVASFIREMLFENDQSFCFETVMSHISKLQEIAEANDKGYQCYLYFVCTDDAEINISRVFNRVEKGGHKVDEDKVKQRYYRTLNNLFPAIELCHRSFLFDNSGEKLTLIAEIFQGKELMLHVDTEYLPDWFNTYVLPKYIS